MFEKFGEIDNDTFVQVQPVIHLATSQFYPKIISSKPKNLMFVMLPFSRSFSGALSCRTATVTSEILGGRERARPVSVSLMAKQ